MPSDADQGEAPQSIEARIGALMQPQAEETAPEVETAPDTETVDQAETPETEESAQEQEPAIEEVEVEVEGWKGKIPAKLKAEIDKGADYTRKTQALAEEKRLFESQLRTQQEHAAFFQRVQPKVDQLRQIDVQLEQYRKVDLSQIDSENLSRMSMAAANLREERAKLQGEIDSEQGQFKQQMLGSWNEMTQRARNAIVKDIPQWDSVANEVAQFALREGYPFEVITGYDRNTRERVGPGVVDPLFAKTLFKAMQYDKLQTGKATTLAKANKAPPVVKPGGTPSGAIGERNYKEARAKLGKTGSLDDAVALLRMRERRK